MNLKMRFFFLLPLRSILFLLILIETRRSPFDLVEGESELVSGFSIEYGSIFFSFISIGEYVFIIFFCYLLAWLLFNFFWVFFVACICINRTWISTSYTSRCYLIHSLKSIAWLYLIYFIVLSFNMLGKLSLNSKFKIFFILLPIKHYF